MAEDHVGEAWISTLWLGINHNYGDGPPLIFETMVFGGEHDEEMMRYASRPLHIPRRTSGAVANAAIYSRRSSIQS